MTKERYTFEEKYNKKERENVLIYDRGYTNRAHSMGKNS